MKLDNSLLTLQMQRNGEWSVIDMGEVKGLGHTSTEQGRGAGTPENGGARISRKREDDSHRNAVGRAGTSDPIGKTSGQRSDSEGNGESGAANHSESHAVKAKCSMEAPQNISLAGYGLRLGFCPRQHISSHHRTNSPAHTFDNRDKTRYTDHGSLDRVNSLGLRVRLAAISKPIYNDSSDRAPPDPWPLPWQISRKLFLDFRAVFGYISP